MNENDYQRFLKNIKDFSKSEIQSREAEIGSQYVEFICYCLNPNHFHFLLKQVSDKGIEKFMHKLGIGYTMYFNRKYNRSGSLFQGKYKALHVQNNSYFIWLSAYINGNSEIHKIAKADNYLWSSYPHYLGRRKDNICKREDVLNQYKNIDGYQDFVRMVIKEARANKKERKGLE